MSRLSLQAKQSLATLTKDVPKRHSLAMPGETVLNGNQEWVVQADLPLTAAIRQSQQTLYHSHPPHPADRQGESCPHWPSQRWGRCFRGAGQLTRGEGCVGGGARAMAPIRDGPQAWLEPEPQTIPGFVGLSLLVSQLCLPQLASSLTCFPAKQSPAIPGF